MGIKDGAIWVSQSNFKTQREGNGTPIMGVLEEHSVWVRCWCTNIQAVCRILKDVSLACYLPAPVPGSQKMAIQSSGGEGSALKV